MCGNEETSKEPFFSLQKIIFCLYWLHRREIQFAMLCYAKSLQSCPTQCDPIDGSPPSSRPSLTLFNMTDVQVFENGYDSRVFHQSSASRVFPCPNQDTPVVFHHPYMARFPPSSPPTCTPWRSGHWVIQAGVCVSVCLSLSNSDRKVPA